MELQQGPGTEGLPGDAEKDADTGAEAQEEIQAGRDHTAVHLHDGDRAKGQQAHPHDDLQCGAAPADGVLGMGAGGCKAALLGRAVREDRGILPQVRTEDRGDGGDQARPEVEPVEEPEKAAGHEDDRERSHIPGGGAGAEGVLHRQGLGDKRDPRRDGLRLPGVHLHITHKKTKDSKKGQNT